MTKPKFQLGEIVVNPETKTRYYIAETPERLIIEPGGKPGYTYAPLDFKIMNLHALSQEEMEDGRFVSQRDIYIEAPIPNSNKI